MPLFFILFFSVYGLANFYVIRRAMQGMQFLPDKVRFIFLAVFIIAAVSYLATKTILSRADNGFYDVFLWMGSFWFAILLYAFLFNAAVDGYRFISYGLGWITKSPAVLPMLSPMVTFFIGLTFVILTVGYGFYNTHDIKTKHLTLNIHKGEGAPKQIKIAYFSDLHLTPVNNGRVTDRLLNILQAEKPDLILMGGDIVDDKPHNLYRHGLDQKLRQIKAPLGAYTCPGNHEYITGKDDVFAFMRDAGISVLADTTVVVGDRLQITGRDDASARNSNGQRRAPLETLAAQKRADLPAILLDHQPFNLEKAAAAGYDLQLSGHTHHGQMFPFNLITKRIYEVSWGFLKKNNTNYYVSSGIGTWGPPIRTGSDCEIIIINLTY